MPAGRAVVVLSLVAALAGPASGQTSRPATQPIEALDRTSVVFDWNTADWKPKVVGTPPLLVGGGFKPEPNTCRYNYGFALSGRSFFGTTYLHGYLGGPFPAGSAIVADAFEREGGQIRLVFRYEASPPATTKRNGDVCFFGATLGDELPDGTYDLTVQIKDLPPGLDVPAVQRLRFQVSDPRIKQASDEAARVNTLSPEALFAAYRDHAATMKGFTAPHEGRFYGTTPMDFAGPDERRLEMFKREMIRRGKAMGPVLLEALKEQATRNAELPKENPLTGGSTPPPGMARELMDMLTQIGDARAAAVMLEIISGKLRCNRFVVRAAVEHIEKLTCVRFRKFEPHHTSYADAVCGPDAAVEPFGPEDRGTYVRDLAAKYDRWLATHPARDADVTPWKHEAIRMARAWLDGDDISEAYNAASFLRSGNYNPRVVDDDPDRTTRQIAAKMDHCEAAGSSVGYAGRTYYTHRYKPTGQTVIPGIFNWAILLTSGPSVPSAYAAMLIRLDKEMPKSPGMMASYLLRVGGAEAMAHRVETYRQLLAETRRIGVDPNADIFGLRDTSYQMTVWNCQWSRWGIERWAGRTFATDAELDVWWTAERNKSQKQWLESGLPVTATRADAGERQSQHLLRLLLDGKLPNPPERSIWLPPGTTSDVPLRPEGGEPFRVSWVTEHTGRLRCDVERGTFVLDR